MLRKVKGIVNLSVEKLSGASRAVALCMLATFGVVSMGEAVYAADTIPDVGVDWTSIASEGTTKVGTILLAGVGVIIAIGLFKMACRFFSNAFAGKA